MTKATLALLIIAFQLIGGIIALVIFYLNGEFKNSVTARRDSTSPTFFIIDTLVFWELALIGWVLISISDIIDKFFYKKFDEKGGTMKAILFDYYFEAPDELNEFCKSIGYDNPDYSNFDLMFDSRVVEFCEQRLSPLWNEKVYKGKDNYKFKCGFAGAGYIRDIDTTKKWRLTYNNVDAPIVDYVDVKVNDYGLVSVVSEKK